MTELSEILTAFEQALILENELGTRAVDIDRALLVPVMAKKAEPAPAAVVAVESPKNEASSARKPVEQEGAKCAFPGCVNCKCACTGKGRTDAPDFMFVGDVASAAENGELLPFAGGEGALLEKIITAGMKYKVEDIFITTVCKRAVQNSRIPPVKALGGCIDFLKKQIDDIRPRVIILFGRDTMDVFPVQYKMQFNKWYEYNGIPLVAVRHPGEILRLSEQYQRITKMEVWNTIKAALNNIGK